MEEQDVMDQVEEALRQSMSRWIGEPTPPDLNIMRDQLARALQVLRLEKWVEEILDRSAQLVVGVGSAQEMESILKSLDTEEVDYLWEKFGDGIPFLKFEWSKRHDFIMGWSISAVDSSPGRGTNATIEFQPMTPLKQINIEINLPVEPS